MSILGNLIAELEGTKPAVEAASPTQADLFEQPVKRSWNKPVTAGDRAHSHGSEGDIIQLPRTPPFPAVVLSLNWGGRVPEYVFFNDGLYVVEGWANRVSYKLVEWIIPPWRGIDVTCKPPDPAKACVYCGRRLFWRADLGEFCACCHVPDVRLLSRLHVAEPTDSYEEAIGRITFFLKEGVGYD